MGKAENVIGQVDLHKRTSLNGIRLTRVQCGIYILGGSTQLAQLTSVIDESKRIAATRFVAHRRAVMIISM
jgi:hypothetical protein